MTKRAAPAKEDKRLIRVTKICLAPAEATRCCQGLHAGFMVGKKAFTWFLNDHHGDGIVAIACKMLPGDNTALVAAQPDRFYPPAYMAHHGWVALRLDVGEVDWDEVAELVACSYQLVAPKRLAALVKISP
jgi:predicted DNA-binding protein (MmcQ/YjbR family)